MRWLRTGVGLLGVLGLVLAWSVSEGYLGGLLPVEDTVTRLGNDYFVVAGLAGVAIALALPVLVSGRSGNVVQTEMPDPEVPIAMATPGDAFDETTASLASLVPVLSARRTRAIRDRLRDAAIEAVARTDGCTHAEAERRIERGMWTTDRVATAFVARSVEGHPPVGDRVRALLDGETVLQYRARRTVDAIADYDDRWTEVIDGGRDRH